MKEGDRVKIHLKGANLVDGKGGIVVSFGFTPFYQNTPPDYGANVLVRVENKAFWFRPSSLTVEKEAGGGG